MQTNVNNQKTVKKLSEYIDYYEVCNRAEGKSQRTIACYSSNLRNFNSYLKNRHLPDSLDNIDTKLLREYVLYLLKNPKFNNHPYTPATSELLSASTVHGHIRILCAFFSWLVREALGSEVQTAYIVEPLHPKVNKVGIYLRKLSTLQQAQIMKEHNTKSLRELAREYGVSYETVRRTIHDVYY